MTPALRRGVRLGYDEVRGQDVLLYPEGVLLLNETAAAVLELCDGSRTVETITAELAAEYEGVSAADIVPVLAEFADQRVIEGFPPAGKTGPEFGARPASGAVPRPLGLIAELTHRCPLRCAYCSNPLELVARQDELDTQQWLDVFRQARDLGVLQLHLTGGEPLARADLAELVAGANALGLYTGLVTSGITASARFVELAEAGLDHVQLSVQDAEAAPADAIAGIRAHDRKREFARFVKAHGLPLTVNVVLHRGNIDHVDALVALSEELGADRLELANTQYYGWAQRNWSSLLPSREQIDRAFREAERARERVGDRMDIVYVLADYYEERPKPCMAGWGMRQLVVTPSGEVLPCLSAGQVPDLGVPNVRDHGLADIWYDSAAFNRFRGTDWMPEPCRDCAFKEIDFGGCRCQAFQLLGDAAATDPVCSLSPHHGVVSELVERPFAALDLVPRRMP